MDFNFTKKDLLFCMFATKQGVDYTTIDSVSDKICTMCLFYKLSKL